MSFKKGLAFALLGVTIGILFVSGISQAGTVQNSQFSRAFESHANVLGMIKHETQVFKYSDCRVGKTGWALCYSEVWDKGVRKFCIVAEVKPSYTVHTWGRGNCRSRGNV